MKHLLLICLLCAPMIVFAQNKNTAGKIATPAKEQSNPAAKAILEKMKAKYQAYKTLEVEFNLSMELAEQAKELQKGKMQQQGGKYRVDFNGQTIICDAKTLWVILPNNKEVQINNAPSPGEDDGILSPQALFNIYQSKDYLYAITNEYSQGSRVIQEIEFKPIDKMSEYSKLRLSLDKKTLDFIELRAFAKDGSRYVLQMSKITPNKALPASTFTFNKANYPGFHVEDLRD
jgi:outer membrane lipoprotein carrier protein